jgi:recombination protein RecA
MFINQLRMKIGVVFGNPETTTGGRALGFYASIRLDIRRVARIKDGDEDIGNRTRVKVVKNKLAPPYRQAEFDMYFQGDQFGVSREADLLDLGVDRDIISKSGTWFSYEGERLGQGRENARNFLVQNPQLAGTIEARLREALGLAVPQTGGDQAGGDQAVRPEQ